MKTLIVGGVAGGASCAARLRRLDEKAEIIGVDKVFKNITTLCRLFQKGQQKSIIKKWLTYIN